MRTAAAFLIVAIASGTLGAAVHAESARGHAASIAPIIERPVAPPAARAFAEGLCSLDAKAMIVATSPTLGIDEERAAAYLAVRGPAWCRRVEFIGSSSIGSSGGQVSFFILSGPDHRDWLAVGTTADGLVVDLTW